MDNAEIKLTQMTSLHGCSCKLRERDLDKLLTDVGIPQYPSGNVLLGPGDDAGAIRIRNNLAYVTHLDFFTPIIDDPYLYGMIAACNSASDVFVKGAINNLGILIIMGFPLEVPVHMLRQTLEGVKVFCEKNNAAILGGHTIINAWPILGAAVTATIHPEKLIRNSGARPRDILVLTKPLGVQAAMGALRAVNQMKEEVTSTLSERKIKAIADFAIRIMATSNKNAAEAMLEVGVDASTDITGFGIMGQARLMAKRSGVNIKLTSLPVIKGTLALSSLFGYGLERGESAETSGGVLIAVPFNRIDILVAALKRRRLPAYEVGLVEKGKGEAFLAKNKKIIEVPTNSILFQKALKR